MQRIGPWVTLVLAAAVVVVAFVEIDRRTDDDVDAIPTLVPSPALTPATPQPTPVDTIDITPAAPVGTPTEPVAPPPTPTPTPDATPAPPPSDVDVAEPTPVTGGGATTGGFALLALAAAIRLGAVWRGHTDRAERS